MIDELDIERWKEFDIELLYKRLVQYMKNDFMGKEDCRMIHTEGNMLAGETPVTHTSTQGGSSTFIDNTARQYENDVRDGNATIARSQESGDVDEF